MEEAFELPQTSSRNLRDRKQAMNWYGEDEDEEAEGTVTRFRIEDKVVSDRFPCIFVTEMKGRDLSIAYLQDNGFRAPMLFRDAYGLGLEVPSSDFTVKHVKALVGSRRLLDVMDVATQKNEQMTMKKWCKYYNDPAKTRLLNVISLEFSHTKLAALVHSPTIVRQIDWVDACWPEHLKEMQTESTNAIDDMMYPKVQKYCLMSVKGCYTDFHIDFGGTSVWYHILKGSKIFWLIPPTDHNLELYKTWVLSGKQSDVFFGDTVDACGRLKLTAGNTFFIPSGWIHAVYTPEDSLVFGGNFLHSFAIERQIRIAEVESDTHVPQKFRYPFFTEMLWYVLAKYVFALNGTNHLTVPVAPLPFAENIHLTSQEFLGLKSIVSYLIKLKSNRKNVPEAISDPSALIRDVKRIVNSHRNDRALAVSGRSILTGLSDLGARAQQAAIQQAARAQQAVIQQAPRHFMSISNLQNPRPLNGGMMNELYAPLPKRVKCGMCYECRRLDRKDRSFVPYQSELYIGRCNQPVLGSHCVCFVCNLDGWGEEVDAINVKVRAAPSFLMECSVCFSIAHPQCFANHFPNAPGIINGHLPNSWVCPSCNRTEMNHGNQGDRAGYNCVNEPSSQVKLFCGEIQPKIELDSDTDNDRARYNCVNQQYVPSSDVKPFGIEIKKENLFDPMDDSDNAQYLPINQPCISTSDVKQFFSEKTENGMDSMDDTDNQPSEGNSSGEMKTENELDSMDDDTKDGQFSDVGSLNFSSSLEDSDEGRSGFPRRPHRPVPGSPVLLKTPIHIVRPTPIRRFNPNAIVTPTSNPNILLSVFRFLTPEELFNCALVSRTWARYAAHHTLWRRLDVTNKRLGKMSVVGIAKRQPELLILNWTNVDKRQLYWLISRQPQLRGLSLHGSSWPCISALCTCLCPPLHTLDLSYVQGLNDTTLRTLFAPPTDSRPGLVDTESRLQRLRCLRLAGSDISDLSIKFISRQLAYLMVLDISSCPRLTDAGVLHLTWPNAPTRANLTLLDLSNLRSLTPASLDYVVDCRSLMYLNISFMPQIPKECVTAFLAKRKNVEVLAHE